MIAEMSGTRGLQRTRSVRRKPWERSVDLKDAIANLRQLTDRLSTSMVGMPHDVVALVEMLQAQAQMIEALVSCQTRSTQNSPCSRTGRLALRDETQHDHEHKYSQSDNLVLRREIEDMLSTHIPRSRSSPGWIERTLPNDSITPTPTSATQSAADSSIILHEYSHMHTPEITISPRQPQRQQSQAASILQVSPSSQRSQHYPVPTIIEDEYTVESPSASSPPPPPLPPKDSDDTYILQPLTHCVLPLPAPKLRQSSSTLSLNTKVTTASCSTCDTQQWQALSRTDPRESDLTCEAHVQEAASSLIANMKEKRRTPVGPLDCGTFNLYSSDYRNHYCVHDRPDRQSLLVYSKSTTWEADFPGVPAPAKGEVAMELVVYPDCLLIVKPFKVPKHASWTWHSLEAIGDNAQPTTIEIMFLGNGFIKARVRLSELLGDAFMDDEEPERFIEFSGIWSASPAASTNDGGLTRKLSVAQRSAQMTQLSARRYSPTDTIDEEDNLLTPCVELPGDSSYGMHFYGGLGVHSPGDDGIHLTVPRISYS